MTSKDEPRRKIGRPSKGPRRPLFLRLPIEMHEQLGARAEATGVTVNDYVQALIERDLAGPADDVADPERIAA